MNSSIPKRLFLRRFLGLSGGAVVLPAIAVGAADPDNHQPFNVRNFGAVGDGVKLDTTALQQAIDMCARAGGGTVHFPAGIYLSGTLFLKSHVGLNLDSGAVLLGSPNLADYPPTVSRIRSYTDNYTERSLIYGENLEQVSIQGQGVIDGQGAKFKGPYKVRPYLVRLVGCRHILARDITLKNSPMWVQHYLACDDVCLDNLTVSSHCNSNNDGIDIDACHHVRIANCHISSGDDAIVLKSTLDRACKEVAIANCILSSDCNAFKLGTESNGGFENITLSNCLMYDTRLAGIALEMVDGGRLDQVNVANVSMRNVACPLFIRLSNRARPFVEGRPKPGMGSLQNILLSNIQAMGANRIGCSITGLPGFWASNITLENIHLSFVGGGKLAEAGSSVPEHPEQYPEYGMFGPLPAYGLYCRHVKGLRCRNIRCECAAPDPRPSLLCDDVDDLELCAWDASAEKANPVIHFNQVRHALIHGCRSRAGTGVFLRLDGADSEKIKLLGNDLTELRQAVEFGESVPEKAATVQ